MNNLSKLLIVPLFSLLFLSACSESNQPIEGKQFSRLPTAITSEFLAPITEVFSLSCGHCRTMEKFLPDIKQQIDTDIDKLHVTFNNSAKVSALIYYSAVMQLNAVPDKLFMESLFNAIQENEGLTLTEQQAKIEQVFTDNNLISPYKFSDIQQKALLQMLESANKVTVAAKINAVPTFIVNGKYQVILSGHQNPDDIAKTITYLLTK
ncbi:MAG: thiol:disulfide interchange protein DsbA/DsbL [Aliivibrio sp.]|uniref:thiol:disulfide interchange protein DsbA/DsbL n=1 Tax=Aliivibrio sp. TaxID=1872443 RepID=UPI001A486BC6|nr:thiol:disulfide interchange protein DsbA/DsbL [Aliivibrio sp.]